MINELPDEIFDAIITCEDPNIKPYKISNAFTYDNDKEEYRFWKPCGRCVMCENIKNNNYYHTNKPYPTELDEVERKNGTWVDAAPIDMEHVEDDAVEIKTQ
jgi:hypothetical protein